MVILLIADHDNASIKPVTLNVLAAAKAIGGDIDVLVAVVGKSGFDHPVGGGCYFCVINACAPDVPGIPSHRWRQCEAVGFCEDNEL